MAEIERQATVAWAPPTTHTRAKAAFDFMRVLIPPNSASHGTSASYAQTIAEASASKQTLDTGPQNLEGESEDGEMQDEPLYAEVGTSTRTRPRGDASDASSGATVDTRSTYADGRMLRPVEPWREELGVRREGGQRAALPKQPYREYHTNSTPVRAGERTPPTPPSRRGRQIWGDKKRQRR